MEEKKDFKEVKVKVSGAAKEHTETLDRSMLYSGVNIFGTLTNLYLSQKDQFQTVGMSQSPVSKPSEALSGASGNSMMSLGNEVLAIFKKMQKRDSITKIKACHELKKYVDTIAADSEELPNLLTFFLYHLCRILLNEQDKLVREATHDAFTSFIRKDKRRLGPHIKKIFPLWYCAFFDPSPEVGRLAKSNFDLAFPTDNQPKIFLFSFKMFLNFCNLQLQQSIDDTSQDKKANEEIFDRVTCSVLQALANSFTFIKKWSVDEQTNYHKKLVEIFELDQPTKGKQANILWNFLNIKYKGSIKGACLQFIAAFIADLPQEIVKDHVKHLTPAIMQCVAEQNPILQTTFWREALFTLCKKFPDCWDSVQIKKDVLPKLYKCLKENAFGAPNALYENFVKFLSVCPLYKLDIDDKVNKASFKDRCGLIREVLLMLYQGIQADEAVSFHQELLACYFECVTFVLLKRLNTIQNDEDTQFAVKQMEKVLQLPLKDFVSCYQKSQSKHQKARTLRSTFQLKFVKMLEDLAQRQYCEKMFKQICEIIVVELSPASRNAMRIVDSLQALTLSEPYQTIIQQYIVSQVFNRQTQAITKMVNELGRQNIEECYEHCRAHSRIVYTAVKKGLNLNTQLDIMQVGDLLTQVIKKEQLARNVLSQQQLVMFKDLQTALVEISVLYLAVGFQVHNQFAKILLALGLLDQEVSQLNSLEQVLFRPDFPKAKLDSYYSVLRESDEIHDLMVGALSLKMLAPEAVVEYQSLVNQVIDDSVHKDQHAILNEDDLELIRTQVVTQLYSDNPVQQTAAYFKSVQALCITPDVENDEIRDLLLEALIKTKEVKYFDQIWVVFESAIGLESYQQKVIENLRNQVTRIIDSKADLQEFNHLTKVIKLFVQKSQNKVHVLSQILLREQNFNRLEDTCLPLKMFKDLFLQGGVGFDVQQLFTTKTTKFEYVWLASVFLSIKHLVSLSSLMELRRQLMIFVETEVMPAITNLAQSQTDFIIDVFEYLQKTNELHTFDLLARIMGDQSEPVLKVDDFKRVFQLTQASANSLLQSNFSETKGQDFLVVTLQTLGYFVLDEPVVVQLYNAVRDNLLITITKLQLDVYMALDQWFGQDSKSFQLELLSKLLQHESHEMQQISITLMHSLLQRYGQTIQSQINCGELYNVLVVLLDEVNSCQNMITLCKVIRKTQSWYPDSLAAPLLHAARDRAEHFDKVITMQLKIKPFEVEMLQEIAETILVSPLTINENSLTPSIEENLYYLFGCCFEPLQKAAYVLLKFIYENFIPPVEFQTNEEDDLENLVSKVEETKVTSTAFKNISPSLLKLIDEAPSNEENQDFVTELDALVYGVNEEGQMNNKVFGYLLAWNTLLLKIENGRIKSQLQGEQSQYLQVLAALTEFLETDNTTYHMLLLSLVPYLPKIGKKGVQDSYDIQSFQPEYCNLREPKHAQKLCLMSLINFMKSFPSLGRKFYQECDKQLLEVMLPYIKTVISPAILENEIKKIEMSQLELGASSDLTFVLFKSTKEVIATYNKSAEISCQLKIKIPHDYPLKSVVVDIGEQLKLKQTQIRRWTLSIRNLLQSRNGDIISAILLWKSNIDREMQGIEECTICYSVMHQTDKSLPSMQCRNCKNKFHVACIRKWFNTSNKSNCPLCQTFFFQ